jgi:hypothetical protein
MSPKDHRRRRSPSVTGRGQPASNALLESLAAADEQRLDIWPDHRPSEQSGDRGDGDPNESCHAPRPAERVAFQIDRSREDRRKDSGYPSRCQQICANQHAAAERYFGEARRHGLVDRQADADGNDTSNQCDRRSPSVVAPLAHKRSLTIRRRAVGGIGPFQRRVRVPVGQENCCEDERLTDGEHTAR